ncbi:MAG: hypothetical protein JWN70_2315 [Planctomycetaceae bacterium]|nr:hypothetical protein [Planctomycetaceae bacterium]
MTEPDAWQSCQFGADSQLEHPNVHDNFVYALNVQLEEQVLVLHTQYRDGAGPYPFIDLRFLGVVAHHFDDLVAPSILFDIEQVDASWIVEVWGDLFVSRKNYGWPISDFADLADLSLQLTKSGVVGYRVWGSCGLGGFILAQTAEFRCRTCPAQMA